MPTLGGYVSEEIYNKYDALAKEMGISKSKLVGTAVTTSKIISSKKDDLKLKEIQQRQEIKKAIDRIEANVNQIAVHCNVNQHIGLLSLEKLGNIERLLVDVKQNI